ncbi:hypothetical protein GGR52DRAFT_443821 [Hypoxylon sp. FL1284]|nr:hypothetical protein GGR52DRAFT_443821 [Hypoxylon sp. FL1284]
MVVRRALTTAGCSHCRLAVLKLFTSPATAGPTIRAGSFQYQPQPVRVAPIRAFSSEPTRNESSDNKVPEEEDSKKNAAPEEQGQHATEDTSLANIPWYLQVEPPRHVAPIEPPPLPEVPAGSPGIIGSLLEYASEDLGLDELSLLDLRELNPPAALGPNLFMLFGTARSQRHLNVSAGRLVRWLRAKHRVHANADGLLGPNERKLKLRRQAKRAKLLGGVGDTDDDGIKTGWVCVNLGIIDRGKEESAVIAEDGRVAGFGVAQEGSTVVVQLMTEFRRAEMGLETLWKQALGQPTDEPAKSETEDLDDLHPLERAIMSNSPRPPATSKNSRFNDTSRRTPFEQTRFYSTQLDAAGSDTYVDAASREFLGRALKFDVNLKKSLLKLLQDRLDTPSPFSMQQDPDPSNQYQDAVPFLRLCRLACQGLPPHQTWGLRLETLAKLSGTDNPDLTEPFDNVQHLLEEMNLYGIEVTRQQCLQLLSCIYSSNIGALRGQPELGLQLLKTMQQRGQEIFSNDIIVTIIEAMARQSDGPLSEAQLEVVRQLEDLLLQAELPCMEEPLIMRLMEAHYRLRLNWEGFWNAWRIPPRYLRPRSAAMYVHAYRLAAATRSPKVCAMVLRRCFQEMLAEDPPVLPDGDVRAAAMECIRVADPRAEQIAQSLSADGTGSDSRAKNEFVKLVVAIAPRAP